MHLTSIDFKNFRNIVDVSLKCSKNFNVIVGDNGQGKSNLLEGISLSLRGQSFRPTQKQDFVNFNSEMTQASLKTEIEKSELSHQVSIKLSEKNKEISLNEKRSSSHKLRDNFSCILFSPESLAAIKSGPEVRRSLVDELTVLVDPRNLSLQRKMAKVLKARNRVLKDHVVMQKNEDETRALLKSLDGLYIGIAADLTLARLDSLNKIQEHLSHCIANLYDEKVDISVDYTVSGQNAIHWDREKIINAHRQRRLELLASEMSSGTTLVGPHKHDVRFNFNGHDSRYYCSQGQQRAVILAFKMAQILYHGQIHKESLILLLDDVLSELDQIRQNRLMQFLLELESQVFLTTTDATLPGGFVEELLVMRVNRGEVAWS